MQKSMNLKYEPSSEPQAPGAGGMTHYLFHIHMGEGNLYSLASLSAVERSVTQSLQGYLAHKKQPLHRTLQ